MDYTAKFIWHERTLAPVGGWTPENPGYNHELEHQIKDRVKESKDNYQKHQK